MTREWHYIPQPVNAIYSVEDIPQPYLSFDKQCAPHHKYEWGEEYLWERVEDEHPTYVNSYKRVGLFSTVVTRSTPVMMVTKTWRRDYVHFWYAIDGSKCSEIVDSIYRTERV